MEMDNILKSLKVIAKAYIAAIILFAVGVAASGLILMFTDMKIESTKNILIAVMCISSFICGFFAASAAGKRGLLSGIAAGALFVCLIYICMGAYVGFDGIVSARNLILLLPVFVSGIGGVAGVGR